MKLGGKKHKKALSSRDVSSSQREGFYRLSTSFSESEEVTEEADLRTRFMGQQMLLDAPIPLGTSLSEGDLLDIVAERRAQRTILKQQLHRPPPSLSKESDDGLVLPPSAPPIGGGEESSSLMIDERKSAPTTEEKPSAASTDDSGGSPQSLTNCSSTTMKQSNSKPIIAAPPLALATSRRDTSKRLTPRKGTSKRPTTPRKMQQSLVLLLKDSEKLPLFRLFLARKNVSPYFVQFLLAVHSMRSNHDSMKGDDNLSEQIVHILRVHFSEPSRGAPLHALSFLPSFSQQLQDVIGQVLKRDDLPRAHEPSRENIAAVAAAMTGGRPTEDGSGGPASTQVSINKPAVASSSTAAATMMDDGEPMDSLSTTTTTTTTTTTSLLVDEQPSKTANKQDAPSPGLPDGAPSASPSSTKMRPMIVFLDDGTFKSVLLKPTQTASDVVQQIAKKTISGLGDGFGLYVMSPHDHPRRLASDERPAEVMSNWSSPDTYFAYAKTPPVYKHNGVEGHSPASFKYGLNSLLSLVDQIEAECVNILAQYLEEFYISPFYSMKKSGSDDVMHSQRKRRPTAAVLSQIRKYKNRAIQKYQEEMELELASSSHQGTTGNPQEVGDDGGDGTDGAGEGISDDGPITHGDQRSSTAVVAIEVDDGQGVCGGAISPSSDPSDDTTLDRDDPEAPNGKMGDEHGRSDFRMPRVEKKKSSSYRAPREPLIGCGDIRLIRAPKGPPPSNRVRLHTNLSKLRPSTTTDRSEDRGKIEDGGLEAMGSHAAVMSKVGNDGGGDGDEVIQLRKIIEGQRLQIESLERESMEKIEEEKRKALYWQEEMDKMAKLNTSLEEELRECRKQVEKLKYTYHQQNGLIASLQANAERHRRGEEATMDRAESRHQEGDGSTNVDEVIADAEAFLSTLNESLNE